MSVSKAAHAQSGGSIARRRLRRTFTLDNVSFFVVFLIVPVVGYVIFVVSPFVQAAYYSLTDWSGFTAVKHFIGLANYGKLFADGTFMKAMGNSTFLGFVLPFATIAIALVLATLVTVGGPSHGAIRGLRNSSFYRVVSFFPFVIPAIIVGIMWSMIYQPSNGLLNGALTSVGLDQFESFAWLGKESTAIFAVMFVVVWHTVGFYMVLFIAGIKGVPAEIYEAARVDGAGRFRTAMTITIPLIRDTIQTSYIYMGIMSLDLFVFMVALEPGGGPSNSTLVMSQQLFTTAFTKGQFGYASAMGVILAVITLLFAGLVFLVNRLTGGSNDVAE